MVSFIDLISLFFQCSYAKHTLDTFFFLTLSLIVIIQLHLVLVRSQICAIYKTKLRFNGYMFAFEIHFPVAQLNNQLIIFLVFNLKDNFYNY